MPPRFICLTLGLFSLLAGLTSCTTPNSSGESLPSGMALLRDAEDEIYSEVLQRNHRILLQIELVDSVRPPHRFSIDGLRGYSVPAGSRRVQFRILLPSAGLTDSHAREARGFVDVELVAGHHYQVAGNYAGSVRTFYLLDRTTNQSASPAVDLGFFGPVPRKNQYMPIIIPIKS